MGGVVCRWETFSRCEADWASGFTISFIFESLEIQKWEAIWLWPSPFVKVRGTFFCAFNCAHFTPLGTRNACAFHSARTAFFISFSRAAGAFFRKRGNFPLAMT